MSKVYVLCKEKTAAAEITCGKYPRVNTFNKEVFPQPPSPTRTSLRRAGRCCERRGIQMPMNGKMEKGSR